MPRPARTDLDGRAVTRPPATPRPQPPPVEGRWTWSAITSHQIEAIVYEVWLTQFDERVCPECGPLAGVVMREGFGAYPPLHVNCRCRRALHHVEWLARPITKWEAQWIGPTTLET